MIIGNPYDDLAIPIVMGPAVLVSQGVAMALFSTFFFCEAIRLQYQNVKAAVDSGSAPARFGPFLLRAATILFSFLFLYKWTFLKMVSLSDHIFFMFNNEERWLALLNQLSAGDTSVSVLNASVPLLVGAAAISLLQVAQDLFLAFRFVVLSILYTAGPIVWAFSLSEIGGKAIGGWFRNTWEVSFWIVVFGIVKSAVVPLASYALAGGASGYTAGVVYAIVIVFMITMIPKLTASLFSAEHISALSNSLLSASSAFAGGAAGSSLANVRAGAAAGGAHLSGSLAGYAGMGVGRLQKAFGYGGGETGGAPAPTAPPAPASASGDAAKSEHGPRGEG